MGTYITERTEQGSWELGQRVATVRDVFGDDKDNSGLLNSMSVSQSKGICQSAFLHFCIFARRLDKLTAARASHHVPS